jgi:hypothetical protein
MHGRIFQVTPAGQVVWEYLTPYEDYAVAGEPEVKVPTVAGVDRPTLTRISTGRRRCLSIGYRRILRDRWIPLTGGPVDYRIGLRGVEFAC